MGEKYVQEEFLGEESLGEKSVQEEFLGEESLGEKYMGEKYVQEKKLGEEFLCEKYMGEKSVQEEFLGEKSLGEKYMGEMYWRVAGWKVWWEIGVDGMLAFVPPFSGIMHRFFFLSAFFNLCVFPKTSKQNVGWGWDDHKGSDSASTPQFCGSTALWTRACADLWTTQICGFTTIEIHGFAGLWTQLFGARGHLSVWGVRLSWHSFLWSLLTPCQVTFSQHFFTWDWDLQKPSLLTAAEAT